MSGNATNFTSQIIIKLNYLIEIQDNFITFYYSKTNGIVEKVNRTLEKILKKLIVDKSISWSLHIDLAVFAYNIDYHNSTHYSPFQLLYGRELVLPPLLYSLVKDYENISHEKYLENFSKILIDLQTYAYSNIWDKKIKTH